MSLGSLTANQRLAFLLEESSYPPLEQLTTRDFLVTAEAGAFPPGKSLSLNKQTKRTKNNKMFTEQQP